MKNKYVRLFLFFVGILRGPIAFAQPSNDNCDNPIVLTNPVNSCIESATSVGATASGYGAAQCFPAAGNDVWFSFTATATTVTINITGQSTGNPNLTLRTPQAALYYGTCGGTINELTCGVGTTATAGTVDLTRSGLIVGESYFIRVQGANNGTGTFKLCIKSYNPPSTIDGDCITGGVLCDKSPFSVKFLSGSGRVPNEFFDAPDRKSVV